MKFYFRCPKCGNDEQFVKPDEAVGSFQGSGGIYGGIYAALAFSGYVARRVQCPKCLLLFQQPRIPHSPLARFALWVLFAVLAPAVLAGILFVQADAIEEWLTVPALAPIETAVAAHPALVLSLVALQLVLIVIPSFIAMLISDARFRRQLATQYRLRAVSPRELADEKQAPVSRSQS